MIYYLDTSAAMKLLVEEAESAALAGYFETFDRNDSSEIVASGLLHTELHCAAQRHPSDVDRDSVAALLDAVSLVDLTRGDLLTAGAMPGRLRSHDAVHLAVALRLPVDQLITYDVELSRAATVAGLIVTSPA